MKNLSADLTLINTRIKRRKNSNATPTQYAKTLYELTVDKKHQEIDEVVAGFLQEFKKNGQMKMADY